ncbi:Chloroperoxidase [Flagelloscypha sp. PMI_526]|nr:Chloroperoxidase [Flagelloscypha sp. PMI_526]
MFIPLNATLALAGLATRSFTDGHPFAPAGSGDSRSPCPALNALANHGYINHSGQNIGFSDLMGALQEVYNIDMPLALVLAGSQVTTGISFNGLDLHQLAKHNRIEHDASLGHEDANGAEFAPTVPSTDKIEKIISENPGGLNLESFAKRRVELESQLAEPLDFLHARIARSEAGLVTLIMGDENGLVPVERFRTWFADEKLPEDYAPRTKTITLSEAGDKSNELRALMDAL